MATKPSTAKGTVQTTDDGATAPKPGLDSVTTVPTPDLIDEGGTDTDLVSVKPLRRFTDSETDKFHKPGDEPFKVASLRAAELKANGLVQFIVDEPENKMRQEPETKE